MMVSFIQSNYMGFGSGIVVPGTGISLQNRGRGFTLEAGHANRSAPRKRPSTRSFRRFVTDATAQPAMAFGVMGGPMQSQGHLQMVLRVLHYGQNPQAARRCTALARDRRARRRVEPGLAGRTGAGPGDLGHQTAVESRGRRLRLRRRAVGAATAAGYVAGSDPRKDGQAVAC